jgi:hypothetical protein
MAYALCIMILPVLAYMVYEDWQDAAAHRHQDVAER